MGSLNRAHELRAKFISYTQRIRAEKEQCGRQAANHRSSHLYAWHDVERQAERTPVQSLQTDHLLKQPVGNVRVRVRQPDIHLYNLRQAIVREGLEGDKL